MVVNAAADDHPLPPYVPSPSSSSSSSTPESSRHAFFSTHSKCSSGHHDSNQDNAALNTSTSSIEASAAPTALRSPAPLILSPGGLKPCVICFDMEKDGVQCSLGHFLCRGCLQGFIRNLEPVTIRRSGGCVSCPAIDQGSNEACDAEPWSYDDLATLLDPSTQRMYVQRLEGLLASVLQTQAALTGKAPPSPYRSGSLHATGRRTKSVSPLPAITSGGDGSAADEQVVEQQKLITYRQYIAEEILTLKCPREGCGRAFLDFDGCFALTCPGCGCGFCAVCIVDCGDDAHDHCKEVHQGLFGSLERFNDIQRHRRLVSIVHYLTSLDETPALLDQLLLEGPLAKDLADVGLMGEQVKRVLAGGPPALAQLENNPITTDGQYDDAVTAANNRHHPIVRLLAEDDDDAMNARFPFLRRMLDGPGYPAEDDTISWVLGTVVSASIMVAAVFALTDTGHGNELYHVPAHQLFAGLIGGPSVLMLMSGRGKQLLQAVHVAVLTAFLGVPCYFLSGPVLSCVIMVVVWMLSILAHALGLLLDVTMAGTRFLQELVDGASAELMTVYQYGSMLLGQPSAAML